MLLRCCGQIKALDTPGGTLLDDIVSATNKSTLPGTRAYQISCQHCGQPSFTHHAAGHSQLLQAQRQHARHLKNWPEGHVDASHSSRADASTVHGSSPRQHASSSHRAALHEGSQRQHNTQAASGPALDPAAAQEQTGLQQPFAALACDRDTWQQQNERHSKAVQLSAEQAACKVLRFDPSLGSDGAFYFEDPDAILPSIAASDEQPLAAASASHLQQSAASSSGKDATQADSSMIQANVAAADGSTRGMGGKVETSVGTALQQPHASSSPLQPAQTASNRSSSGGAAPGSANQKGNSQGDTAPGCIVQEAHDQRAAPGLAVQGTDEQEPAVQGPDRQGPVAQGAVVQEAAGKGTVVTALPAFPVQGGGQAGVLLRAAAAAAAGCSHELVVAAAGHARHEDMSAVHRCLQATKLACDVFSEVKAALAAEAYILLNLLSTATVT